MQPCANIFKTTQRRLDCECYMEITFSSENSFKTIQHRLGWIVTTLHWTGCLFVSRAVQNVRGYHSLNVFPNMNHISVNYCCNGKSVHVLERVDRMFRHEWSNIWADLKHWPFMTVHQSDRHWYDYWRRFSATYNIMIPNLLIT